MTQGTAPRTRAAMVYTKRMRTLPPLAVLLLLLAVSASAAKKGCHAGDRAALLAVKAAFNNASYFVSWTPDIPCCAWPGIDCDESTGRVVSLAILRNDDVAGPVPGDAIAGLTRLNSLVLFKLPGVSGAIPVTLARLSRVTELTISRAGVSGPVPSFFGALPALQSLDLSFKSLTGSVPPSLSAAPRLISIDLSRNRLTGIIPPLLLSKAGRQQAFLDLSHNNLSGGVPAEFVAVRFVQVDLSRNQLTGDASVLFVGPGNTELGSVNLSRNALSFDMSRLRLTERLDSLDVSHNMIYGGIPALVAANLTNLQVFNVSYNRLCGALPAGAARYDVYSFDHNKCLCGAPLPNPCQ